jgi:hypothetical protein
MRVRHPQSAMVCRADMAELGLHTQTHTREFFRAGSVSSSSIRVADAVLA